MGSRWQFVLIILSGFLVYACSNTQPEKNYSNIDWLMNFKVDSLMSTEFPDPVAYFDSIRSSQPDPGIDELYERYTGLLYYYHQYEKDFSTALNYADSLLVLFTDDHQSKAVNTRYLNTVLMKTRLLMWMNLNSTALQYLQIGWEASRTENDPCFSSEFANVLGVISYKQENYANAIKYFDEHYNQMQECDEFDTFSKKYFTYSYLHQVEAVYDKMNKPDSSLHYSSLAVDHLTKANTYSSGSNEYRFLKSARGVALSGLGRAHLKLGNFDIAEQALKESIEINMQPGYIHEHANFTRLHLTDLYLENGKIAEAEVILDQVMDYLNSNPGEVMGLRWHRINLKWLHKAGLNEYIYAASQKYNELKEIAETQQRELVALDLSKQIQFFEQQYELARLQSETKLINFYLLSAIIILILSILILFLIWKSWKQSRDELRQSIKLNKIIAGKNLQLEQNQKKLSRVINTVAHDLRSPLNGVTLVSSLMMKDSRLSKKHKKWTEMIYKSTKQSLRMASEVVNNHLEDTELSDLNLEVVNSAEFLRECIGILQFQAKDKFQTLHLDVSENDWVRIDRNKMYRVINNLTYNAIKFSLEGADIFIKLICMGNEIRIVVEDQGIGIPNHLKEHIFDPFTDARRNGTNNESSFGLGLSISRRIVVAHNGRIWFESSESRGTTFYIDIPKYAKKEVLDIVRV